MMAPFQTKREKPQWEYAYDLFAIAERGQVVTYEELGEALQFNHVGNRSRIQQAVHQAVKRLEAGEKKTLEAIPNVGYRVVPANEHVRVAKKHQSRVVKATKRGLSTTLNVDFNELTEIEKALVLVANRAFALQYEQIRRLDIRQRRLETKVDQVVEDHEGKLGDQEERIAKLEARLAQIDK
jgi:hypothetical protein